MTISFNPELGAYFNSLAGVEMGGIVGAPAYPAPYMPPQYYPRPPSGPYGAGPITAPMPGGYQPNPYQGGFPSQRVIPTVPGAPAIGARLQPLGFNAVIFTATSGTALPATTRPQKPFKGRRLVVSLQRIGATATSLVQVTSITVGTLNQLVSQGPVDASAFAGGNFDCNVDLSPCTSALDLSVNYQALTAPTAPDQIQVGTTMFGESVGS